MLVIARSSGASTHDEIHTLLLMMRFRLFTCLPFVLRLRRDRAMRASFNGKTPHLTVCALKTPDSQFLIPVYPFLMFLRTRLPSLVVDMRIFKTGGEKCYGGGNKGGIEHELCINEVAD